MHSSLRRVEPLLAAVRDADDALDPVTPARVSETRTRGAEACTSCRSATSSLAGRLTPRIVRALRSIIYSYLPTTRP